MASANRLGIIAGGGDLPRRVIDACAARGQPVYVVRIKGAADDSLGGADGLTCSIGEVGRVIAALKDADCRLATFAGYVPRPDFTSVRLDWRGLKIMPKILTAARIGDGAILRVLTGELERAGIKVLGAEEAAADLHVRAGKLSAAAPDENALADMAKAYSILSALGPFDVGQAAIVADGFVLAIEAAEGTDAMLTRCQTLPQRSGDSERSGVLLKAPKPGQDLRVDLPVIGPQTINGLIAAGLSGVAVEADRALIVDRTETIALADGAGVFIYGFTSDELAL